MDCDKLRHSSRLRLLNLLSSVGSSDKKDVVIHEDLMKPLDQVAGARVLRDHGVEKMYRLGPSAPAWRNSTRIYMIPALYSVAELVSDQLKVNKIDSINYHVVIVPKVTHVIHALFESLGVLDIVTLHSFSWDFIPLDINFISLEMNGFFRASFVNGDNALLAAVSKALLSFECLFGRFPCVTTLGKKSATVHNLLEAWYSEIQPTCPSQSEFSHLIIMDRDVDLVSPLLVQLTYEGVLDENFKIQSGFFTLNPSGKPEDVQRLIMNADKDEIYSEIRGKHISSVFQHLSSKAKHLQSLQDKMNSASIEEMKQFVSHDLKQIQNQRKSLALHISACEMVMKRQEGLLEELLSLQQNILSDNNAKECLSFLEDSMARRFNMTIVTRLMCLYSLLQDGLPDKDYKALTKQFTQAYGYQHAVTLHKLQRLGLLVVRNSKINVEPHLPDTLARVVHLVPFKSERVSCRKICQRLGLLPDAEQSTNEAMKSGQNASYVYGGAYIPTIYKLTEKCIKDREPSLDEFARCYANDLKTNALNSCKVDSQDKVLVLILGGATLAEVAALDLLGRQLGRPVIVASTSTISGPSLIETISNLGEA